MTLEITTQLYIHDIISQKQAQKTKNTKYENRKNSIFSIF